MRGNAEVFIIVAIVVIAGFFLTGGLFQYKFTNQNTPGAFIPLTPSPDASQKSIQFRKISFLYLTPTPTPASDTPSALSGNSVADYASALVNAIKSHCPPRNLNSQFSFVTTVTESCIYPLKTSAGGAFLDTVINWLHVSTNENGNLQCAGFVQAISRAIGAPLPNGSAFTYAHPEPGYQWISLGNGTMNPGDITVWDSVWGGHIAVVTKVFSNKFFTVAEANGGSGTVGFETYSYGGGYGLSLLGWLRKL